MKFTQVHSLVIALATFLPAAVAHGTIAEITLGGTTYNGPQAAEGNPFTESSTPVRQLALLEPNTDLSSNDTICGRGAASSAKLVANVTAGSEVTFTMRSGSGGNWPHVWGPVLFYMAKCPGSAEDCDATNLEFFKVDQLGLTGDGENAWYQKDLSDGKSVTGKIPKGLQNGDYLLRTEILALHNAMNVGGAESSVACTQVRVSGGGDAAATGKFFMKFPGYSQTDPGILINIWNGLTTYSFPGPAVFNPSSSSSGSSSSSSSTSATSTKHSSTSTTVSSTSTKTRTTSSTAPTVSGTGTCRRRRRRALSGSDIARRSVYHGGSGHYAAMH